jgi:outer membrane protein assembly factor BamB
VAAIFCGAVLSLIVVLEAESLRRNQDRAIRLCPLRFTKEPAMRTLIFVGLCFLCLHAQAADWPQFRGAQHDGISREPASVEWSAEKNIKWKVPLPSGGNSSPIVVGDQVFLNCADDKRGTRRSLYCFDRRDGHQQWVQTVSFEKSDPHHAANPYCASTPASDGKHVVVWHGSAGLHCYDMEGKPLWSRDLGTIRHVWGYGGSPIILDDAVILNGGPGERSFVASIDLKTGHVNWQTDEPGGSADKLAETGSWIGSWSSPVPVKIDGQNQILVTMARHVNSYDPASGKILWTCSGTGDLAYSDPMVNGELNICVAMAGYGGKAIGFRMGGSGDITSSNRLWQQDQKPPQRIGTGVMVGKRLFMVQEPGFICIDPMTGKTLWEHREPGQIVWSSLIAAGDRLYATSQKGTTFVLAANDQKYELLARNEVGEKSNSSIAVSNGQIFLRTYEHLYCIDEAVKNKGPLINPKP